MMPSVSVIVPVFNNVVTLQELKDRLVTTLEAAGRRFELIFVDDGSSDGSLKVLRQLSKSDGRCVVLALSRNFGQHPATSAGLRRASGDVTVFMDADLQDRPEELPRLLDALDDDPDLDIVLTTFEVKNGSGPKLTSRIFYSIFGRMADVRIPPNLGVLRAFRANVREALLDYREHGAVYAPIMSQMGYQSIYVNVHRDEAGGRKTSYTFRRRLSLATSSIISYGSFVHRFVTWTGVILTTLSTTYLLVVLGQYLTGHIALVNGQLMVIVLLLLMSGVLLMTVGFLFAYTHRIFHEVLDRPRYHVAREYGSGLQSDTS